jgi:hypothetical protein
MERIAMSQEERDWLEWLKRAQDGLITQRQAAEKMGITDRWVRGLLAQMEELATRWWYTDFGVGPRTGGFPKRFTAER